MKMEEENVPVLDLEYSITTPEEDAARCLLMLSRAKRTRDEIKHPIQEKERKFEEDDCSDSSCVERVVKNKVRAKYYRCEICSKFFRSFQALGGHKAGHNKIRVNTRDSSGGQKAAATVSERTIACPFCSRVFTSWQAFGGHKRTHFIAASAKTMGFVQSFRENGECFDDIDLNLPVSFHEEI